MKESMPPQGHFDKHDLLFSQRRIFFNAQNISPKRSHCRILLDK